MTLVNVMGNQRARLTEYKAAIEAGLTASRNAQKTANTNFVRQLERKANTGSWVEMIALVKKRQELLRKLTHGRLRQVTERAERTSDLISDIAEPRQMPSAEYFSKANISSALKKRGLNPEFSELAFSSRRSLPKFGNGMVLLANSLKSTWEAIIRRDAQLSLALAVANFNIQVLEHDASRKEIKPSDVSEELTSDILNEVRRILNSQRPSVAAVIAEQRLIEISSVLESIVVPAVAQNFYQEFQDLRDAESSVKMTNALRELLWLCTALKVISWRCTWPNIGDATALMKAAQLPLSRKMDAIPRISVKSLSAGDHISSDFVEVLGIIEKVDIKHEVGGKPVTTFTIREPDGDGQALAVVNGFKADSVGAVAGSAVLLRGKYRTDKTSGAGSIQIARGAIIRDRMSSFIDYLKADTYRIYAVIPHALQIQSSWTLGVDGPLNPIRYGITAEGR